MVFNRKTIGRINKNMHKVYDTLLVLLTIPGHYKLVLKCFPKPHTCTFRTLSFSAGAKSHSTGEVKIWQIIWTINTELTNYFMKNLYYFTHNSANQEIFNQKKVHAQSILGSELNLLQKTREKWTNFAKKILRFTVLENYRHQRSIPVENILAPLCSLFSKDPELDKSLLIAFKLE